MYLLSLLHVLEPQQLTSCLLQLLHKVLMYRYFVCYYVTLWPWLMYCIVSNYTWSQMNDWSHLSIRGRQHCNKIKHWILNGQDVIIISNKCMQYGSLSGNPYDIHCKIIVQITRLLLHLKLLSYYSQPHWMPWTTLYVSLYAMSAHAHYQLPGIRVHC